MFTRLYMLSGLVLAALVLSLPSPIRADTSHPADCTLIVGGKSYISGLCEFSPYDDNGSFSIYGEQHWGMVFIEHGKATASWSGVPEVNDGSGRLGDVRRAGECWEGEMVRICTRDIDKKQLKTIMATRPKGLTVSPEHMESLCASAPGYKFEPGAALVIDQCDHFLGLRQRVFKLTGDRISFEGRPRLCVDAKPSADGKDMRLVLDHCARVTVRWSYDNETTAIRSGNNLCWDVVFSDDTKDGDTTSPMIARPCDKNPNKNGRFQLRSD